MDAAPGPPPARAGVRDPSRPVVDAALSQKAILSAGVITLLALLVAGIIALVAFMLFRPMSAEETLASRGSPPKPQIRVVSTGPDNVVLAWDRVELAERYNLQHLDPKTDNVNKVEALDGALTGR